MSLRPYISSFTNKSIKLIDSKFGLKTLPVFFHGDVYKIPVVIWDSPRIKYKSYMANLLRNNLSEGDTLTSFTPKLVIEIHPLQLRLAGSSDYDVKKYLNSLGYEFDIVDKKPNSIYTIFTYKN